MATTLPDHHDQAAKRAAALRRARDEAVPADMPRGGRLAARYVLLGVVTFVVVMPIYVAVVGSLKPGADFLTYPDAVLPTNLTFQTLRDAWSFGNLDTYLPNSFVVSIAITVGQVVSAVLAAYAFAYLDFPGRRVVFYAFLATLMVPAEATLVANVETIQAFGWIDSYPALIVPFLATAFGTFLLRQVFLQVPKDLREAAALDGLGHWRFLWDVAVPLARPSIGALALFSFLSAWNQYLWPQRVINTDSRKTVQIGLKALQGASADKLNLLMAGTVIAAIPIFVMLVVFQRQLVRGLTAGAVKG